MTRLKELARAWLPPVLARQLRRLWGGGNRFEGNYATWAEAKSRSSGYDNEEILSRVLAATLKVKTGEAAYERDSVLFDEIDYTWPALTGLLWAAARSGGRLNVLDFGGALGSSYFQNRRILQSLPEVRWNVVEQPHYVEAGKKYVQDEQLRFYETIEACITENRPNVIFLSSVLQYLESPEDLVCELEEVGAMIMIIDRTPFMHGERNVIVSQRVPASIYSASYPMWIFSLPKFQRLLKDRWDLVASSPCPEGHVRTTGGLAFSFQGMLLESHK